MSNTTHAKGRFLIDKYSTERPDLNNIQLAQLLIASEPFFKEINQESLRIRIGRYRTEKKNDLAIAVEDDRKYDVVDNHYTWKTGRGIIKMSVEFIDQLFHEYSEHGLNLSQTEIINKHNLKVWEWTSIKSTLWLFKKSNIFSPYTVENTPQGELAEMIKQKMDLLFNNSGYQVEQIYNKSLNKKYREVIKKQEVKDLETQTLLMEIKDALLKCEIRPVLSVANDGVNEEISVCIFDVHYGAENRGIDTPKYNPQVTREQLEVIAAEVNKLNAKKVHIFFGGDIIESFTGMMHPDQWKGMAKGYYGAQLVVECYKLYTTFLSSITNLATVDAVPGNHDRGTKVKEEDTQGWIAQIIFEMIALAYKGAAEIRYHDKVASQSYDGIHYIMSHGDKRLTNLGAAQLILKYGDPFKFNLLISGHWHERRIKQDSENFRQIVCPSIFPGNDYSVDLGFDTAPGFLIVKNNNINNKPTIIDIAI